MQFMCEKCLVTIIHTIISGLLQCCYTSIGRDTVWLHPPNAKHHIIYACQVAVFLDTSWRHAQIFFYTKAMVSSTDSVGIDGCSDIISVSRCNDGKPSVFSYHSKVVERCYAGSMDGRCSEQMDEPRKTNFGIPMHGVKGHLAIFIQIVNVLDRHFHVRRFESSGYIRNKQKVKSKLTQVKKADISLLKMTMKLQRNFRLSLSLYVFVVEDQSDIPAFESHKF